MSLRFGIYGLVDEELIEEIDSLEDHEVVDEVYFESSMADFLGVEGYSLQEMIDNGIDFVMSIGGDGTLLRLMQRIDIPALGVNTGTVGFLTTIEISNVVEALEKIDRDDYFIEKRMKLDVILNGEKECDCVNEVVVHSDKIAKLRKIELRYGDKLLDSFRADGVIISTPTGSTSYAMSAGGPIVNPALDVFVSVPIASFDLDAKPHVLPSDKSVEIRLPEEEKTCLMVMDGQSECIVGQDDTIEVKKSDNRAKFISFEDDFYEKVKKKLVRR
ncbi:MAG: NAD(+)/NADH kinase [Candidatus Thermoplasmatota archaeon]|nr:NAD(+)/NADH kinase [Candidatus Thermoplasmatota archaeon]